MCFYKDRDKIFTVLKVKKIFLFGCDLITDRNYEFSGEKRLKKIIFFTFLNFEFFFGSSQFFKTFIMINDK